MKPSLTTRQKEILDFIKVSVKRRGMPPTYSEMGKEFGISKGAVYRRLFFLAKKGYISMVSTERRSIRVCV